MKACPMLSLCALLVLASPSEAQPRWITISHAGGERVEIDTAEVGITGSGHITVWWRLSERVPHSTPSPLSPTTTLHWSSMTEREEIDCHTEQTRLVGQTLYSAAGDAISVIHADSTASWEEPTPDSVMEARDALGVHASLSDAALDDLRST